MCEHTKRDVAWSRVYLMQSSKGGCGILILNYGYYKGKILVIIIMAMIFILIMIALQIGGRQLCSGANRLMY